MPARPFRAVLTFLSRPRLFAWVYALALLLRKTLEKARLSFQQVDTRPLWSEPGFFSQFSILNTMSEANKKYSESVKRLEEILESIDRYEVGIDELADLVKEAADLIKNCRSILTSTEQSVQESLESLSQ
jgi:exodeoxyribonuclease VII small subunit